MCIRMNILSDSMNVYSKIYLIMSRFLKKMHLKHIFFSMPYFTIDFSNPEKKSII